MNRTNNRIIEHYTQIDMFNPFVQCLVMSVNISSDTKHL